MPQDKGSTATHVPRVKFFLSFFHYLRHFIFLQVNRASQLRIENECTNYYYN